MNPLLAKWQDTMPDLMRLYGLSMREALDLTLPQYEALIERANETARK